MWARWIVGHQIRRRRQRLSDRCLCEYGEDAIEELFTDSEARQFVEFARTKRNDSTATIKAAPLPFESNVFPVSALPTGGGPDFLRIYKADDYDLPFKVIGFYDVRWCEFDENLPGARRAVRGFKITNGKVETWFLDDEE
jgi:hypothetical protein